MFIDELKAHFKLSDIIREAIDTLKSKGGDPEVIEELERQYNEALASGRSVTREDLVDPRDTSTSARPANMIGHTASGAVAATDPPPTSAESRATDARNKGERHEPVGRAQPAPAQQRVAAGGGHAQTGSPQAGPAQAVPLNTAAGGALNVGDVAPVHGAGPAGRIAGTRHIAGQSQDDRRVDHAAGRTLTRSSARVRTPRAHVFARNGTGAFANVGTSDGAGAFARRGALRQLRQRRRQAHGPAAPGRRLSATKRPPPSRRKPVPRRNPPLPPSRRLNIRKRRTILPQLPLPKDRLITPETRQRLAQLSARIAKIGLQIRDLGIAATAIETQLRKNDLSSADREALNRQLSERNIERGQLAHEYGDLSFEHFCLGLKGLSNTELLYVLRLRQQWASDFTEFAGRQGVTPERGLEIQAELAAVRAECARRGLTPEGRFAEDVHSLAVRGQPGGAAAAHAKLLAARAEGSPAAAAGNASNDTSAGHAGNPAPPTAHPAEHAPGQAEAAKHPGAGRARRGQWRF